MSEATDVWSTIDTLQNDFMHFGEFLCCLIISKGRLSRRFNYCCHFVLLLDDLSAFHYSTICSFGEFTFVLIKFRLTHARLMKLRSRLSHDKGENRFVTSLTGAADQFHVQHFYVLCFHKSPDGRWRRRVSIQISRVHRQFYGSTTIAVWVTQEFPSFKATHAAWSLRWNSEALIFNLSQTTNKSIFGGLRKFCWSQFFSLFRTIHLRWLMDFCLVKAARKLASTSHVDLVRQPDHAYSSRN